MATARPNAKPPAMSSAAHERRITPVLAAMFAAVLLIGAAAAFVVYNAEARRSLASVIDSAIPASLTERTTPLTPPSELPRTR